MSSGDRTLTRSHRRRGPIGAAAAVLACAFLPAGLAAKAAAPAPDRDRAESLKDLGLRYESLAALPESERVAALETLGGSVKRLLDRGIEDDERGAARFLSGVIRFRLGDEAGAREAFRQAGDADDRGPFAADAAFAEIRALEASGRDDEAAREWPKWEKRFASSPLADEASLAAACNALRRGQAAEAERGLAGLLARSPWRRTEPRVALARGLVLYAQHQPDQALAALGPSPQGDAATYLRALCAREQGALLRSAALFQETAERYPDSPLRDRALLAKADAFLAARDYRSAGEEFARVAARTRDPEVRAEAELRWGGSVFLAGRADSALALLRTVTAHHAGTDAAARAQFLVGEALASQGRYAQAIVELNRVLTSYFQHSVAASAQYRVARCLDRLGRRADATGTYQAVVSGYPLEPEAPAAAYLAGVGLMAQGRPLAAAPYFQLVLDRYAPRDTSRAALAFASPERQELVEASLCHLELAYHRAGNLGQLSGAPHLLLRRMPPSRSPWRAYALLIDADAAASQGHYPEAQETLLELTREFPDLPVAVSATKLLAWTYARQGRDSLAIAAEERLLARYRSGGNDAVVSGAYLDIAHERFNQKRYRESVGQYEDFMRRFPSHPHRLTALYQAGLCYVRLGRAGDAVDRWEAIVRDSAGAAVAERAWARMGDLYFQAERYADARRCYQGLLEHFAGSSAAGLAMLRLGQCEYNAGRDAAALEAFSKTAERFPGTPFAREAQRGTELALYRLSQSPNGSQVLARLVEQFPGSAFAADAQFQVARRRYQEKRFAEAADGFRRVVSQFPGYSAADQAQFLMADAYAKAGSAEEAERAYDQFASYFPASDLAPTVQFRLGLMRFEAKDFARAAVAFTRALEDSASTEVRSASRFNLALCDRMLGSSDEARAELERYRHEFPNDVRAADVSRELGDLEEAAGHPEQALAEFERGLRERPKPARAAELAFRAGRAREQLGRTDAALEAYRQASLSSDRDNPFRLSAVARIAALYEQRKDYARALAAYRDIVHNAKDRELVAAAAGRVSQLEASTRRR